MIRGENVFHLVKVRLWCKNQIYIKHLYDYQYQSKTLAPGKQRITCRDDAYNESDYPCEYLMSANDEKRFWVFGGSKQSGSSLMGARMDTGRGLDVQDHTPPPFSCVTAMAAGKIYSKYLVPLKPITKYTQENFSIFWTEKASSGTQP